MAHIVAGLLRRLHLRSPIREYDPDGLKLRKLHDRGLLRLLRKR